MFDSKRSEVNPKGFYVYFHRRISDGIVFYVGKGKGDRAWQRHGRSEHWNNIFNKHGARVEIVEDEMEESDAYTLEIEAITRNSSKYLCNISTGGIGGASGCGLGAVYCSNGMVFDDSYAASEWLRGFGHTGSIGTSINACCRGARRTAYGYSWSRERHASGAVTVSNAKKPVLCSNGMRFESVKDAARWVSIETGRYSFPACISRCCWGNSGSSYGYNWEFEESGITPAHGKPERKRSHNPIKVVCSNGHVFDDISDAVIWLKSNGFPLACGSNIHKCINGKLNKTYGYKWTRN